MITSGDSTADKLRAWARGVYPVEAGVELLIRTSGGKLLAGPWVQVDADHVWVDVDKIDRREDILLFRVKPDDDPDSGPTIGVQLSGGERRMLNIAASLISPKYPVTLHNAATGVDRDNSALVLAAIAHAGGSHEREEVVVVDGAVRVERLPSLFPWPEETPGKQRRAPLRSV